MPRIASHCYDAGGNGKVHDDSETLGLDVGQGSDCWSCGRFLSTDPLASERSWVSPYNFVQNSPISRVDPNGALDESVENRDWIPTLDNNGNVTYTSEAGDSYDTFVEQYGEEAAAQTFESNCDGCFDKSETYNEGDVQLTGRIYPLLLASRPKSTGIIGMFGFGNSNVISTDIQDIDNQRKLAIDYADRKGSGEFQMDDFYARADGTVLGSFMANGPLVNRQGIIINGTISYYPQGSLSTPPEKIGLLTSTPDYRTDRYSDTEKEFHTFGTTRALMVIYREPK